MDGTSQTPKPLIWIGSSRDDLSAFPDAVRGVMGHALYLAQCGRKHDDAKPLKGFGGAGVLEIISAISGEAWRTVYTVRLAGRVYVLHAFQKKSKRGAATPQADIELIRRRLKRAEELHAAWLAQQQKEKGQ